MGWKTKETDRFVLKFIKLHISAPVSQLLVRILPQIRPTSLTFLAAALGIGGGITFGYGFAWQGGLLAALAQILDGVDGQVARLTGRVSTQGALLDSALDRYMDFALLFGILFHCLRYSRDSGFAALSFSAGWIILVAGLAAAGCSQVSYVTARATSLKISFARPELAGKGSRTTAIILCGLLTPLWIHFPMVALLYLAIHPNLAVMLSLARSTMRKVDTRPQA